MDMVVVHLAILSGLALIDKPQRKQHLAWGIGFLALFLGTQTVARVLYYGDILPNTYYLKMTGYPLLWRITRGAAVFWSFIWDFNIILFLLPGVVFFASPGRIRGICAWVFGTQCLYSIYVGGDAWEFYGGANRYIAPVMPLFFVLIADSFVHLKELAVRNLTASKDHPLLAAVLKRHIVFLLVIFTLIHINLIWEFSSYSIIRRPSLVGPNMQKETSLMLNMTKTVEELTTPDAHIAVTWAGMLPYFSGRYSVDILGKTDRFIAHLPMHTVTGVKRFLHFYPGHLKYDYSHSIGEQKPDIIVQLWQNPEEAQLYLKDYIQVEVPGSSLFFRTGSNAIHWEKLTRSKSPESH
jgi:arabinofuranosyltransferase